MNVRASRPSITGEALIFAENTYIHEMISICGLVKLPELNGSLCPVIGTICDDRLPVALLDAEGNTTKQVRITMRNVM